MTKLTLALTMVVTALAGAAHGNRLEAEVRDTYDRFRTAVEKFDTAAVSEMVVPGLVVSLPNGQNLSRSAYLKALSDRKGISEGTATHSFVLSGVHESGGYVTAFVRLTLNGKFRDGNQMLHTVQTVERKTLTFRREGKALKLARIDANEVRTSVDGKTASVVRRS